MAPPSDWVGGPAPGWPHRGELFSFCPSSRLYLEANWETGTWGVGAPMSCRQRGLLLWVPHLPFRTKGLAVAWVQRQKAPYAAENRERDGVWQVRCGFES